MTQEQYNRAVRITHRLNALESAKNSLESQRYKLGYLCDAPIAGGATNPINQLGTTVISFAMDRLTDILDCHDKMIREEIDAEIEKLKKEIETL